VKSLDENDPQKLWDVLKSTRDDLERIHHVLRGYDDFAWLEKHIYQLRGYRNSALRIFYDFGKESNPIKDRDAFIALFLDAPNISLLELEGIKKSKSFSDNFVASVDAYHAKLIRLVGYWIYRVRCSIAHNKLGEYHLEGVEDLEFLMGFAEPLLVRMVGFRMGAAK
jgi:hypothetical protein